MKKLLLLLPLIMLACSGGQESNEAQSPQEVILPNYDSLVGKQILVLKVDGWDDWSMWNETRTKVQGHIYAGETSTILEAKELQGSLRYKVTNSRGQIGYLQSDVCELVN